MSCTETFGKKHHITQVTQNPYSPDLAPCNFWFFSKLKSPLKGKRFQTIDEIQENTMGQQMAIGRTVWSPRVPTLKGTEVSLSHLHSFLYLASSSINASIFHYPWLDTFWTDLVYWEYLCYACMTVSQNKKVHLPRTLIVTNSYLKIMLHSRQTCHGGQC